VSLPEAQGPSSDAPASSGRSSARGADPLALLDRLTWGANGRDAQRLAALGSSVYIAQQLRPTATSLPPEVQAQLDALTIVQTQPAALVFAMERMRREADAQRDDEIKKKAQQAYQQELTRLAREAAHRSLMLALYSPNQVQEKMSWFWFNHFNVHMFKHNLRAMVGDYEDGLRRRALGRFRDLLRFTTRHPAMLRYLDNEQNAANRINENYARELLELHTLGVDGGYAQRDVQELARVLTGVGVNLNDPATSEAPSVRPVRPVRPELAAQYLRDGLFEFNPNRHDYGEKTVLGQPVRAKGLAELDEVVERLSRHPSTARFVARKLAMFWVADEPPAALVERLAARFTATDGDIAAVLASLFASREFTGAARTKFRDPIHYVVAAVRFAYDDKVIANTTPMQNWLNRMGQGLYNRQTPDGYPLTESAWSSPGQMSTRFEVAKAIGSGSAGLFRVEPAAAAPAMGGAMMATAVASTAASASTTSPAPTSAPTSAPSPTPAERPAFPQLANRLYYERVQAQLAPATRAVLDQAASPQEWNTLLLSSPEFMFR
jgi:uncharacterized protein (DUF1800 family)